MARAGFTTVGDLGGNTSAVTAVRDAVAEGRFPGPRIKVSGAPLSIIGGHADGAPGLPPRLAAALNEGDLHPSVCTRCEENRNGGPPLPPCGREPRDSYCPPPPLRPRAP